MNPTRMRCTAPVHAFRASSVEQPRLTFRRADGTSFAHIKFDVQWRDQFMDCHVEVDGLHLKAPAAIGFAFGRVACQLLNNRLNALVQDPRWARYRMEMIQPFCVANNTGSGLGAELRSRAYPDYAQAEAIQFVRAELAQTFQAWMDSARFRQELGPRLRQELSQREKWPAGAADLIKRYEKPGEVQAFLSKERL